MKAIVGIFFEKKRNTPSILAILLVGTICYVVVAKEKYDFLTPLMNIIFVVVGLYFGPKPCADNEEDDGVVNGPFWNREWTVFPIFGQNAPAPAGVVRIIDHDK